MKPGRRTLDIFSLSFLDIISCGFGAVVLLVLISKNNPDPAQEDTRITGDILSQVLQTETAVETLKERLQKAIKDWDAQRSQLRRLKSSAQSAQSKLAVSKNTNTQLSDDLKGLSLVQISLNRASISQGTTTERDAEVGGIPVESDYVVFIIDTSGSMKEIWHKVTREVENVINIHPKIKGFQILNDNGAHIVSAYAGKWIPDTPQRRKSVINLLKSWNSTSNSSPIEGLETALKRYASRNVSVSIYIFGDDYSGSSFDPVINALDKLNTNRITGKKRARVHGVGFISNYTTGRFATLMREITRRNNGTFIALPK